MKRFYYLLLLVFPVIIYSCQKELSLETGRLPGDTTVINPPTTNNCKLSKVVIADKATNFAFYAHVSSFNTAHQVVTLDLIDSASNTIDKSFTISYPNGRVQLDPTQYFLLGSDGKISEFHGYDTPEEATGEKITAKYTYNSAGQMTLRTVTYDSLPGIVLLQTKFTYTGSNLTKQEFEGRATLTTFVKIAEVNYTYDATKTVKNFLYLYGFAPEIMNFQTAIDAGVNNANAVSKAVVTIMDPSTNTVDTTLTSNFVNYVIDSKNYVQSFDVTGSDLSAAWLFAPVRYKLSYTCY